MKPPEFFFEPVPHKAAIDFIKSKPAVSRDVFNRLLPALKARAFVIAGVEAANVVQSVRDTIATLPAGGDWKKIRKQIAEEIHPYVANPEDPDNLSAAMRRAELLIRTHGFQAYQAANVATMRRQEDVLPFWQYLSMQDGRVRAAHRALEGKVLPADHPFWHDHTPPWEWGCRCQIVPLSPEDVDDLNAREKDKAPEERSVLPPHVLAEIERTGHLVTGPSNVVDVRSPKAKGQPGAFEWDPLSMSLPMDQLKSRYDAPVWAAFEGWAKKQDTGEGATVWEWLTGIVTGTPPPAKPPQKFSSIQEAQKYFSKFGVSCVLDQAPNRPKLWGGKQGKKASIAQLEIMATELERLNVVFPKFQSGLHSLLAVNSKRGRAHLDGPEPWLSAKGKEWTTDAWDKISLWEAANGRKWTTERKGSQIRDNFRHELGHTIATPQVLSDWTLLATNVGGLNWFRQNVSEYAATKMSEALAETFGLLTREDYIKGSLPTAIEDFIFKTILKE